MPMRKTPSAPFAEIDLGDAKGPLLRRQTADFDVRPFNGRKNHHLGRGI